MFNESIIRAYNKTRKKDYFLKEELLYLNEEGVSYDNVRRKELIKISLSNFKKQKILRQKIEKHNLTDFVDYWELLGFFDYEEETKIELDDVIYLSKDWLKNFSAIIDLANILTKKHTKNKDILYLDEEEYILHKWRNPEYYSHENNLSIDSIVKTTCFQQVALFSTSNKKGTYENKREAELLSIQIELKYMLRKKKLNVSKEKRDLFADILYNLSMKSQYSAIEKINNITPKNEDEFNLISTISNSLNKTLNYLKEHELLLKIIIMNEIKR